MKRRTLPFLLVLGSLGCTDDGLGAAPEGNTSPILTSVGDGIDSESADEIGTDTSDLPSCDPFADPAAECGVAMDCDPELQQCVSASGSLGIGDGCSAEDECAPGLICKEQRCRSVCDPEGQLDDPEAIGSCPASDVCVLLTNAADWGVCLTRCSLVSQDCSSPGEGCNRATGAAGLTVAACTDNFGSAGDTEICMSDSDCQPGLLCTPESEHTLPCSDMAESCCTFVCDTDILFCPGIEIACYTLGIAGQDNAGYCGPL